MPGFTSSLPDELLPYSSEVEAYLREQFQRFATFFANAQDVPFEAEEIKNLVAKYFAPEIVAPLSDVNNTSTFSVNVNRQVDYRIEYKLEFRHVCSAQGCRDLECTLCQYNPLRLCDRSFCKKYLVGDSLKAKCGANLKVVICNVDGEDVSLDTSNILFEVGLVNGVFYKDRGGDVRQLTYSELQSCIKFMNHREEALLQHKSGPLIGGSGRRIYIKGKSGVVNLPDLQVTDSSEALLSGRRPPFRLAVMAVSKLDSSALTNFSYAISEEFVVATRRVKQANKADVPLVDDHVSKIEHIGRETVKKLKAIGPSVYETNPSIFLPFDLGCVTTVGEFRGLVEMADKDAQLKKVLQLILKLSKEKWDEAAQHVHSAVVSDFRRRVWYPPGYNMAFGLLFNCRYGSVALKDPVCLISLSSSGPPHVVAEDALDPISLNTVRQLKKRAVQSWSMEGHPGWGIFFEVKTRPRNNTSLSGVSILPLPLASSVSAGLYCAQVGQADPSTTTAKTLNLSSVMPISSNNGRSGGGVVAPGPGTVKRVNDEASLHILSGRSNGVSLNDGNANNTSMSNTGSGIRTLPSRSSTPSRGSFDKGAISPGLASFKGIDLVGSNSGLNGVANPTSIVTHLTPQSHLAVGERDMMMNSALAMAIRGEKTDFAAMDMKLHSQVSPTPDLVNHTLSTPAAVVSPIDLSGGSAGDYSSVMKLGKRLALPGVELPVYNDRQKNRRLIVGAFDHNATGGEALRQHNSQQQYNLQHLRQRIQQEKQASQASTPQNTSVNNGSGLQGTCPTVVSPDQARMWLPMPIQGNVDPPRNFLAMHQSGSSSESSTQEVTRFADINSRGYKNLGVGIHFGRNEGPVSKTGNPGGMLLGMDVSGGEGTQSTSSQQASQGRDSKEMSGGGAPSSSELQCLLFSTGGSLSHSNGNMQGPNNMNFTTRNSSNSGRAENISTISDPFSRGPTSVNACGNGGFNGGSPTAAGVLDLPQYRNHSNEELRMVGSSGGATYGSTSGYGSESSNIHNGQARQSCNGGHVTDDACCRGELMNLDGESNPILSRAPCFSDAGNVLPDRSSRSYPVIVMDLRTGAEGGDVEGARDPYLSLPNSYSNVKQEPIEVDLTSLTDSNTTPTMANNNTRSMIDVNQCQRNSINLSNRDVPEGKIGAVAGKIVGDDNVHCCGGSGVAENTGVQPGTEDIMDMMYLMARTNGAVSEAAATTAAMASVSDKVRFDGASKRIGTKSQLSFPEVFSSGSMYTPFRAQLAGSGGMHVDSDHSTAVTAGGHKNMAQSCSGTPGALSVVTSVIQARPLLQIKDDQCNRHTRLTETLSATHTKARQEIATKLSASANMSSVLPAELASLAAFGGCHRGGGHKSCLSVMKIQAMDDDNGGLWSDQNDSSEKFLGEIDETRDKDRGQQRERARRRPPTPSQQQHATAKVPRGKTAFMDNQLKQKWQEQQQSVCSTLDHVLLNRPSSAASMPQVNTHNNDTIHEFLKTANNVSNMQGNQMAGGWKYTGTGSTITTSAPNAHPMNFIKIARYLSDPENVKMLMKKNVSTDNAMANISDTPLHIADEGI